jgi:hypothetical protein
LITVPRFILKRFRTLCRRGGLHKYRASNGPVVTLIGGPAGYRMNAASPDVAIEYRHPDPCDAETIRLPLDALEACEGRDDAPVMIEARSGGGASLSWVDRGVPRQSEVEQPQPGTVAFPDTPTTFTPNEPGLWPALRDAVATTDESSTRYALACLHLRGKLGTIEATDGRQVLIQSNFRFGFDDDVLVPGSKLLGSADLADGEPVNVVRAGDWIGFGVGRVLVMVRIQKEGRFPKLDQIMPSPSIAKSRLELTAADARFLADTLPRLPCDDELHGPITLDLNGQVLVRSRESDQGRPTEVLLAGSKLDGEAVILNTNRFYVERALQLGFRSVCLYGPEAPALCVADDRRFLWSVLDGKSAIPRSDEAVRLDSSVASPPAIIRNRKPNPMSLSQPAAVPTAPKVVKRSQVERPQNVSDSPIEQTLALRDALRIAARQANDLLRSLKRQKRQSRIVESTLASLKQLQKVAG